MAENHWGMGDDRGINADLEAPRTGYGADGGFLDLEHFQTKLEGTYGFFRRQVIDETVQCSRVKLDPFSGAFGAAYFFSRLVFSMVTFRFS
ncbi:unnamed protein product [Nesidiocoris tenuis]|uniref:Uncharacterized protein n=1 Tax=Nesidiocoris tenuis TaxID=355587 RepID=A0A6H5H4Y6_9HEMI|nr:unnamed protein product [Nesidiocoris tenuis]